MLLVSCVENPIKESAPAQTSVNQHQPVTKSVGQSTQQPKIEAIPTPSLFATVDKECKKLIVNTTVQENIEGMADLGIKLAAYYSVKQITGSLPTNKNSSTLRLSDDKAKIREILWAYSKNYVWLPMSIERLYGEKLSDLRKESGDVMDREDSRYVTRYSQADQMLRQVTSAIKEKHDYQFEAILVRSGQETAEAIPGGKIFISAGLIRRASTPVGRDYALFVISHEIAHVLQRHQTKHLQDQIMDTIDLVDLVPKIKALSSGNGAEAIVGALIAGKQLYVKNYSDQELQADSCGVKLVSNALGRNNGRVRVALTSFITHLKNSETKAAEETNPLPPQQNKSLYELAEFVSSPLNQHPKSDERYNNFNEVLASLNPIRTGAEPVSRRPPRKLHKGMQIQQ